ncbi:HAD-IA family hydrolase [Corallococcus exiguus]|uniref:HAD-IA family hydrolase n=1 Tax=Corallococcus exiguus TaxID=83462 RepID=UPI00155FD7E9|nr:HAD-IA family hydrolase [Corallococcus exiguus]
MAKPAYLFDLDMTLLDTSALLAARTRQNWGYIRSNLNLVKPFTITPNLKVHEIPGMMRGVGHPVAIVTSAPRWYAQALLQSYGVPYDVLVASGDAPRPKPDPAPLQKALNDLGVAPGESCYVGDAKDDFEASYRAGILSIGAGWNQSTATLWQTAPDIFLYEAQWLLYPHMFPQLGYIAEVLAAGRVPTLHAGSILQCGLPTRVALGRYFPTADARHVNDPLARLILTLKNHDTPSALFGTALAHFVNKLQPLPTFATCVPPKPSQQRIRFAATLQHLRTQVNTLNVFPDGMKSLFEVTDYKRTHRGKRASRVHGAFASNYTWGSKAVLLLDDVLTSGATTDECARILTAHQASSVLTVCLSADQDPFVTKPCPVCIWGVLRFKTNSYNGTHFWGCSRWKKDKSGCNYTEDHV